MPIWRLVLGVAAGLLGLVLLIPDVNIPRPLFGIAAIVVAVAVLLPPYRVND